MATKAEEIRDPKSAWNTAEDDVPMFILKATDKTFVYQVNNWINVAMMIGVPSEKIDEAVRLRDFAISWQGAQHARVKVPD